MFPPLVSAPPAAQEFSLTGPVHSPLSDRVQPGVWSCSGPALTGAVPGCRATGGWCAAQPGARTTPCATCSPTVFGRRAPLAGASASRRCCRRGRGRSRGSSRLGTVPAGSLGAGGRRGAVAVGLSRRSLLAVPSLHEVSRGVPCCFLSVLCVWALRP